MNPSDTAPLVLVVEDDAAIAEGLALNLRLQGYRAAVAGDGDAAILMIESERPDLVLLDISLPKRSGISVLETMRGNGDQVPVIVLSARQDEFDKVAALRLGADDYVTKPFALAELLARVVAVLRRSRLSAPASVPQKPMPANPPEATHMRFGDIEVDVRARTVTRGDKPVKLTHLEFELLTFLCKNEDRVFSREELLLGVWGMRPGGSARTVDNFVAQLRAKLETDPDRPVHLLTVRGSGYRFTR